MTRATTRILWIGVIVALGLFAYSFFSSKGKITVVSPLEGTSIFLDNVPYRTLNLGESLEITVDVGTHSILTSKDGYFPWVKSITLEENTVVKLTPFMLPITAGGTLITLADPEHASLTTLVEKASLPIRESRKKSENGNVEIWAAGNAIFANWIGKIEDAPEYFCTKTPCDPIIEVFEGAESIGNLDFYKSREDVLIFSAGNGIFAIETDPRGTKNFQPIYTGTRPRFVKQNNETLYVVDANTLVEIII